MESSSAPFTAISDEPSTMSRQLSQENSTSLLFAAGDVFENDNQTQMSIAETATYAVVMSALIVATIVGNILVVMSVFTYGPLKTVPNFFVASLACADLTVAVLVMPFSVVNFIIGRWTFGKVWCQAWLTFDILTCTASILHLCAIALDRYHAIHDPIAYALQRTRRRVVVKIVIVWFLSAIISVPPLIGWNGGSLFDPINEQCSLTDDRGFVVYSAAGSFYIPLAIMTVVYVRIFRATRARLRVRAKATAAARLRAAKSTASTNANVPPATAAHQADATTITGLGQTGIIADCRRPSATETGNGKSPMPSPPPPPTTHNDQILCATQTVCVDRQDPDGTVASENKHPTINSSRHCVTTVAATVSFDDIIDASKLQCCQRHHPQQLVVPQIDADNVTGNSSSTYTPRTSPNDPASGGRKPGSGTRYSVSKGAPVNRQLYEFMEEKQRISLSKERRAARTMAIIMGAFVACWLPFFVMYVLFPFCSWCANTVDFRIVNLIVWLGYVNSALNPVIYTIFNIDFRRAFQSLLTGRCRPTPG